MGMRRYEKKYVLVAMIASTWQEKKRTRTKQNNFIIIINGNKNIWFNKCKDNMSMWRTIIIIQKHNI